MFLTIVVSLPLPLLSVSYFVLLNSICGAFCYKGYWFSTKDGKI